MCWEQSEALAPSPQYLPHGHTGLGTWWGSSPGAEEFDYKTSSGPRLFVLYLPQDTQTIAESTYFCHCI